MVFVACSRRCLCSKHLNNETARHDRAGFAAPCDIGSIPGGGFNDHATVDVASVASVNKGAVRIDRSGFGKDRPVKTRCNMSSKGQCDFGQGVKRQGEAR